MNDAQGRRSIMKKCFVPVMHLTSFLAIRHFVMMHTQKTIIEYTVLPLFLEKVGDRLGCGLCIGHNCGFYL